MFRTVTFLYVAGVPKYRQMYIYVLCMHLYGFTCLHVRVSLGTRGVPGARPESS